MTVATVHIKEYNGSTAPGNPPTIPSGDDLDDIPNINLVSIAGADVSSTAYPVTAGNRSFSKWVVYELHASNDSNKIDNFQVWMDPLATATDVFYKTNLNSSLALTTSVYPTGGPNANDFAGAGDGNVETVANFPGPSDPGAENIGVSESGTSGLTGDLTHSDFIAIQLNTSGSTPPGNLTQKTFHFQYDEQ